MDVKFLIVVVIFSATVHVTLSVSKPLKSGNKDKSRANAGDSVDERSLHSYSKDKRKIFFKKRCPKPPATNNTLINELKNEISRQRRLIDQLNEEKNDRDEVNREITDELKLQIFEQRELNDELNKKLKMITKDKEDLIRRNMQLTEQFETEIFSLQETNNELNQSLNTLTQENKDLSEKNKQLTERVENDIPHLHEIINGLNETNNELNVTLKMLTQENKDLNEKNRKLTEQGELEMNRAKKLLKEQELLISNLKTERAQLLDTVLAGAEQKQKMRKDLAKTRTRVEELEKINQELRKLSASTPQPPVSRDIRGTRDERKKHVERVA